MSKYKFRAIAVTDLDAGYGGRFINVVLDMDTPHVKEAFLALAGDCRGTELDEWMAELGYTITEIEEAA